MKSMFQYIAAVACAAALAACGGGAKTPTVTVAPQPDYKIIVDVPGTGTDVAAAGDLVVISYVGYLYDATKASTGYKGAKVESSVDTGQPAPPFLLGTGTAPTGWDMAITGMKLGGQRTVVLPANLAYGTQTRDAVTINGIAYAALPANSPMVYDFVLINKTTPTKPVVVPPPTTVQFQDLVVGTGTTAVANGKLVTVRYTGWLYDGSRADLKGPQFDSNVTLTDPLTVNVGATTGNNTVIPGFSTGMIGMVTGGSRRVFIPPDQAYGAIGTGTIPPNATLIFEIQLISVN